MIGRSLEHHVQHPYTSQPCGCNLARVILPSVDSVYTPADLSRQTAGPEKLTGLIYDAGLRRRRQRRETESESGGGETGRASARAHFSIFLGKSKGRMADRTSLGGGAVGIRRHLHWWLQTYSREKVKQQIEMVA